jgi:hypothetical protein
MRHYQLWLGRLKSYDTETAKTRDVCWGRYDCINCHHLDMSHERSKTNPFGFHDCMINNCKCKEFVYGSNYD